MRLELAVLELIRASGNGVIGVDLFHTHMPAQIKHGTLVLTRVPITVDPYTGMREGTFQVIVRSAQPEESHDKASAIAKALRGEGAVVNWVKFLFIHQVHEPLVFPRTEGALFEASLNFQFAANWE